MTFTMRNSIDLGRASRTQVARAERGVAKWSEHTLEVSNRYVPLEEGTLERTGVASSDGLTGAVSYDTPYAARQHEELHWLHDDGRSAKYLERAMAETADAGLAMVAREMRAGL